MLLCPNKSMVNKSIRERSHFHFLCNLVINSFNLLPWFLLARLQNDELLCMCACGAGVWGVWGGGVGCVCKGVVQPMGRCTLLNLWIMMVSICTFRVNSKPSCKISSVCFCDLVWMHFHVCPYVPEWKEAGFFWCFCFEFSNPFFYISFKFHVFFLSLVITLF